MGALLKAFWDICLLRTGPQRLPTATGLMYLLLLVHFVAGLASYAIHNQLAEPENRVGVQVLLLGAGINSLFMFSYIYTLLTIKRLSNRLPQTVSALAGCEIIIGVIFLCVLLIYSISGLSPNFFVTFYLAIYIWALAVTTYIIKEALSVGVLSALLLAIFYIILLELIVGSIFKLKI